VSRGGPSAAGSTPGTRSADPPATPAVTPPLPSTPPPAVPAPPRGEAPLPFERAQIRIDSTPSHAEVRDMSTGKVVGMTPVAFTLAASRTPRQFGLHRKDYLDAVIEIVPEHEKIDHTEKLERGTAATPAAMHRASDPARPAKADDPTPAAPPAQKPAPPSAEPAGTEPPASDSDAILLKPDPSRIGSGSGTR